MFKNKNKNKNKNNKNIIDLLGAFVFSLVLIAPFLIYIFLK